MAIGLSFGLDSLDEAQATELAAKWVQPRPITTFASLCGTAAKPSAAQAPLDFVQQRKNFAAALAPLLERRYAFFRITLMSESTRSSILVMLDMAAAGQRLCPIFGPPGTGKTFGEATLLGAILAGLIATNEPGCLAVFSQPDSAIYQLAQDMLGLVRNSPVAERVAHIMAGDSYSEFVGGEGDPTGLTLCISGPNANPQGRRAGR